MFHTPRRGTGVNLPILIITGLLYLSCSTHFALNIIYCSQFLVCPTQYWSHAVTNTLSGTHGYQRLRISQNKPPKWHWSPHLSYWFQRWTYPHLPLLVVVVQKVLGHHLTESRLACKHRWGLNVNESDLVLTKWHQPHFHVSMYEHIFLPASAIFWRSLFRFPITCCRFLSSIGHERNSDNSHCWTHLVSFS